MFNVEFVLILVMCECLFLATVNTSAMKSRKTVSNQMHLALSSGILNLFFFLNRTGPMVNLTVGKNFATEELPSTVFDLRRDDSYLFVGQPPKDFQLPANLKKTTLVGGFDNLFIDRRRVGLYDALVSIATDKRSLDFYTIYIYLEK